MAYVSDSNLAFCEEHHTELYAKTNSAVAAAANAQLEEGLGQMKKYQTTIDYLTQENEGLKEKVNSEKSVQKQMEVLMLKKENEQLRRFVQRIPPEVRQALKEQQQGQRRDKDRQR